MHVSAFKIDGIMWLLDFTITTVQYTPGTGSLMNRYEKNISLKNIGICQKTCILFLVHACCTAQAASV